MSSNVTASEPLDLAALPQSIDASIKSQGTWGTLHRLNDLKKQHPSDARVRGFCEILRGVIVRDFLAKPKGLHSVPRLTAEFLTNFDRFNLSAQEGYLVSLIDGRLDVQKILVLSPFDGFTALFNLASLEHQKAITFPT